MRIPAMLNVLEQEWNSTVTSRSGSASSALGAGRPPKVSSLYAMSLTYSRSFWRQNSTARSGKWISARARAGEHRVEDLRHEHDVARIAEREDELRDPFLGAAQGERLQLRLDGGAEA